MPAPNCIICKNCTDIFYDFENGPYMVFCKYNTKSMQSHFPNCDRFQLEENLITVSEYIKKGVKMIKLISGKGNCIFYLEKRFFFTLTITKFKKLLKCLDFNDENFKNLNKILNISESYKNKDKINDLIINYIIKNYKGDGKNGYKY